jgi:hypothetical protein
VRKKRIVIYGGTDLDDRAIRMVEHTVRALLEYPDTVIVTGGIVAVRGEESRIPTDLAARRAAEAVLGKGDALKERLESWLPDPDEDERRDLVRDWQAATRKFEGSTAEGRRFALVLETDAIITFKGLVHTATVLELALRSRKPALPIPFTGGDSARYWKKHRDDFKAHFKSAEPLFAALDSMHSMPPGSDDDQRMQQLADQIARAVVDALERWCLVLMPFGDWASESFFQYEIGPAIETAGFRIDRLDQSSRAGHIPEAFRASLSRADAIIADISDVNPNVMYELGHVHGRNVAPFLYWRRAREEAPPEPPFYFKPETLQLVDPSDRQSRAGLIAALGEYLTASRIHGMPGWPEDARNLRIRGG